jgi:hypothetical protein
MEPWGQSALFTPRIARALSDTQIAHASLP